MDAIERNGGAVVPNAMKDAVRARVDGAAADGSIAAWPDAVAASPFGRGNGA